MSSIADQLRADRQPVRVTLDLINDPYSRNALRAYATACASEDPATAGRIRDLLTRLNHVQITAP